MGINPAMTGAALPAVFGMAGRTGVRAMSVARTSPLKAADCAGAAAAGAAATGAAAAGADGRRSGAIAAVAGSVGTASPGAFDAAG
jgi:hypothetical protein